MIGFVVLDFSTPKQRVLGGVAFVVAKDRESVKKLLLDEIILNHRPMAVVNPDDWVIEPVVNLSPSNAERAQVMRKA